jgi:hypothetical protein
VLFCDLSTTGFARSHEVTELDGFIARAVQNDGLRRGRQVFKWRVDIEPIVLCQRLQNAEVMFVATIPPFDRATGQAQAWECHHSVMVENIGVPQSIAAGACAHRRVE